MATTYTYDGANRLTNRTDTMNGRSFGITLGYDSNDNVSSIQYPTGRTITYTYDAENRVTSAANSGGPTYAGQIAYHPSGAITSYLAGNGLTHTTGFDTRYRVQSLDAGGRLALTYGYDAVGNPTSITESTRSGMNQRSAAPAKVVDAEHAAGVDGALRCTSTWPAPSRIQTYMVFKCRSIPQ